MTTTAATAGGAPVRPDQAVFALVIPVFNEQAALPALLDALRATLTPAALAAAGVARLHVLFVDDGSTDATARLLAEAIGAGFPGELIRFSRNFGHQAAVTAGLAHARADVVGVIDADLQDPPAELPAMLARWRAGADVVYGVRRQRKENLVKRAGYRLFYGLIRYLTEGLVPADAGDFCVMDRRAVDAINALPETLRFVRGIRAWVGFRQEPHPYERAARAAGRPKYGWRALYKLATDGIATSSIRPLRIAQLLSILFFALSLAIGAGSLVYLLTADGLDATLAAVLLLTVFCSVSFFLLFLCLYVLSAYVGRGYIEAKRRPAYVVMERIGGD
ncbi:MAG: glycosyltransferase [Alphaproteobacteria bacterium]